MARTEHTTRTTPSKITTTKSKKELSFIKSRLIELAKKYQPVLLYGKEDIIDRCRLVHIIRRLTYVRPDKSYPRITVGLNTSSTHNVVIDEMKMALANRNHKKIYDLLKGVPDRIGKISIVDCELDDGKTVFKRLTDRTILTNKEVIDYIQSLDLNERANVELAFGIEPVRTRNVLHFDPDSNSARALRYFTGSHIYKKGPLFINNLRCDSLSLEDRKYYSKLALVIEKEKEFAEYKDSWLVVYTYDYTTFPQQFLDQFELVSLDGEDYEVKEKQEERATIGTPVKKEELAPIFPSGTKWSDVKMCLIDKDHFKIIIKDGPQKIVTYSQMGFKHKSSTKKNKLWEVLLRFATNKNSSVGYYAKKTEVEKDMQRLNNVLRKHFGITERPIEYHKDKKAYVSEFMISDSSFLKEHMDSMRQTITEEEILDKEIDNSFS